MSDDNEGLVLLSSKLIEQLQLQGSRHVDEVVRLTDKIERHTEVVQGCLRELTEVSTERVNLTKCIMEMKDAHKTTTALVHVHDLKLVQLSSRWVAVKVGLGVNVSLIGLFLAWVKLS